jgi:hypothetical protein
MKNKIKNHKIEDKFTLRILEDEIKSVQKSISQTKKDTNTILEKIVKLEALFLK